MSRYRKIEVKTWTDESFRSLSPLPPCGQGLWFYLLTGPHTGPVPGLFSAGRACMAEELDWELEDFDKAFQEVFQEGMVKADFKARLVWLPKALKHNKPTSPNVVRSWRDALDILPECALKTEALAAIKSELKDLGEPYLSAYNDIVKTSGKTLGKTSPKPFGKTSPRACPNQEQEQEQEQDIVVVVVENEKLAPVTDDVETNVALKWVEYFMNEKGYAQVEAQTAETVPLFIGWVKQGVTKEDMEIAELAVSKSLKGNRPTTPMYYKPIVENIMKHKHKNHPDKVNGSSNKQFNSSGEYYDRQKHNNEAHHGAGRKLSLVEDVLEQERRVAERYAATH